MKKNICIILSLLLYTIGMQAEVRLPGIFSDKMVLQRDTPIPLWGFADPKETVVIEFNGKQYKTRASQTGEWAVNLQKHKRSLRIESQPENNTRCIRRRRVSMQRTIEYGTYRKACHG